ncbi:MAG: phosphoribosylanthranilate isomerase [Chlamydiales bacterium]|nr:phosphoribosylanthranilate isomerase [Chlamydiia bacterium]MCP5504632.1 phosphoribosylanthranilate isomerase [Chlamydiales bacterium]
MTLVKICGVTDPETAYFAAVSGAAFVGIIFAKDSKRVVDPDRAIAIAKGAKKGGAKVVGVFVEQNAEAMQKIIDHVGLDAVQLHGPECRKTHGELSENVMRFYVCPVSLDGFVQEEKHHGFEFLNKERDYLLYDGLVPGEGQTFEWDALEPRRDFNFILAGGLNPENVSLAIKKKQPDVVDVASGVENPKYKKDKSLIQAFIREVS